MHELTGRTHWHEPTGSKRAGFGKFGRPKTPYDLFMESEGIPIFRDIGVSKVQNLPLAPWKRLGGRGTYIQLYGTEGKWGCYVVEVPGAGALNPEKHLYEEIYLRRRRPRHHRGLARRRQQAPRVRMAEGLAVLDSGQRHGTASSTPARRRRCCSAGTTAPNVMNLINNVDAIFNSPYQFRDRFSGADDFYKYKDDIEPDPVRGLAMRRTNFIPDIVNCDLPLDNRRSPGYRRVEPFMTGNTLLSLDRPARERPLFQGARAHLGGGADLPQGQGLHLHLAGALGVTPWKDGHADEVKRVDYEPVGMVSAAPGGARWYPPAFRRLEGAAAADRLVRPAQSRPRARPARREAHRLHRDGHPGGRHRDPVLDGRPVHQRRI